MVEIYSYPLDPDTKTNLKIYLFKNVLNVETIRNNIVNGVWNCAAIKPSLVLDPLQIAVAANRAVVAEKAGNLVTRTVYGEILYNLSLSKNISQSLSKFGVEKDNALLMCFLINDKDESDSIIKQIQGELCPISELHNFTNMKEVKSVYKLNSLKSNIDLLDIIVSRMVIKNFVTY
ncbi:EKC/KEOPS complex subunit Tprkb-like [Zerene cesonia]|uniref:EKC/KEOPS complex subunit Tprkb-like n=1 Tax=Zerene cesonia TaxID=33412 RepID=UPI0018E4F4E5|nr:EKC/KEOPS complex subunit Tprkb-like [Zerene cesonia]